MAIKRHRRSYVVYQPGYDPKSPDAVALEFYQIARARRTVLGWGHGSYIVEWVETFNKDGTTDDCTDRVWIVKHGRLGNITKKVGNSIFG